MSGELIKVAIIVIIAALLIITLRSKLQEYAFLLTVAVVVIALVFVLGNLVNGILKLRDLLNQSGNVSMYFTTALKALGIAYIAGFAADVCRDYGLNSLAVTAETAGKIAIFVLSIPLADAIMTVALKFVDL
ncbi:MAG: SpoIIIAC/SpoIIIAD family protein [Clostridia bacterium]|nr:SpoIIIAC/SpoIIIAD family protein [Clostridia bacterium]